jgi:energy-coupling factor transporter ATP-binding protein EcfA2
LADPSFSFPICNIVNSFLIHFPLHYFLSIFQDMESIDALAKAVQEFEGGMVLVSHDMRLISQVAKEIWICDNKTITKYNGDILNFKMDMRAQMGIESDQQNAQQKSQGLRGDASVQQKVSDKPAAAAPPKPKPQPKLEVVVPPKPTPAPALPAPAPVSAPVPPAQLNAAAATTSTTTATTGTSSANSGGRYIPPHLRRKASS